MASFSGRSENSKRSRFWGSRLFCSEFLALISLVYSVVCGDVLVGLAAWLTSVWWCYLLTREKRNLFGSSRYRKYFLPSFTSNRRNGSSKPLVSRVAHSRNTIISDSIGAILVVVTSGPFMMFKASAISLFVASLTELSLPFSLLVLVQRGFFAVFLLVRQVSAYIHTH